MLKTANGGTCSADNEDHRPAFIVKILADPPLLPGQQRNDFIKLFAQFEITQAGKAKTERDYMMVLQATKLTNEVVYYGWIKGKIMKLYQRTAVENLLFETNEFAGNPRNNDALKAMAHAETNKFYLDATFKEKSLKKIEAVGYGPDAVEVEAFVLSLGVLSQIDGMVAKAEKRLMKFIEELEVSYKSRAKQVKQVAESAIKQAQKE
jgi:hypothetical protein